VQCCDLPDFTHLGLCAQYPLEWKYTWHLLIVVYYFAFGEVAQFGFSYFVDIVCGIFHCCWLLVRYLRRRVTQGVASDPVFNVP
jgi:hypothetical protein